MRLQKPGKADLYATIARMRSGGKSIYQIAKRTGLTEAKVREAIDYNVTRYRTMLGAAGKGFIIAEQALAIQITMAEISRLIKEEHSNKVKLDAYRLREVLREKWLNLLAQAGVVEMKRTTFFDEVTVGMTPEQKTKLVMMGVKRLQKIEERKAAQKLLPKEAGRGEDYSHRTPGTEGSDDSGSGGARWRHRRKNVILRQNAYILGSAEGR